MFWVLLNSFILRDIVRHWSRAALTIAGIALGVAVVLAISLANNASYQRFKQGVDVIAGRTNLQIVPVASADLDEKELEGLTWLWRQGCRIAPVVEELAVVPGDQPEVVRILGVDMLGDSEFRAFGEIVKESPRHNLDVFSRRHAYISSQLADRYKLEPGDSLPVLVNDRQEKLVVTGIFKPQGFGKSISASVVLMDIGPAQLLFDLTGRLTRIDLIIPEERIDSITQRLKAELSQSVRLEKPTYRGEQVGKMLRSFHYNLTALSLIALLVGMFLIYNTMSVSVLRRRKEIGTLRATGVSRRILFALFAVEAFILGLAGSLLGILIGLFFADSAVDAVSSTVQSLYAEQSVTEVAPDPLLLAVVLAGGMAMTLIAAAVPVLEAVTVSPVEATRLGSYQMKVVGASRLLTLIGLALLLLAVPAAMAPPVYGFPFCGFAAAVLAIFGASFLFPLLMSVTFKLAGPLFERLGGAEAFLAISSLRGSLGRTSVACASLMVGIAMMVSLAIMIGSFRQTVEIWVEQTLKADLWVSPAARRVSKRAGGLSWELVDRVRKVEGVKAVDVFRQVPIEYGGEPAEIACGDLDVLEKHGNLIMVGGEPSSRVLARVIDNQSCLVSESFAIRHRVSKGDELNLASPAGPFTVKVDGIYYDYSSEQGFVILPPRLFTSQFGERRPHSFVVFADPSLDPEMVRKRIVSAAGPATAITVRTNSELKREVLRVFDNTFAITYALHAIAILVAILGVMNTLFAMVMESRREFGLLKYLGASGRQIIKMVMVQSAVLGSVGCAAGFAMGYVLSLLLIHVINKQSFGWTVQFAFPVAFLAQSFLLIFATALVSGLIPARLATKTPAPEAVRTE